MGIESTRGGCDQRKPIVSTTELIQNVLREVLALIITVISVVPVVNNKNV